MQHVVAANNSIEKADWLNALTVMLQLRERQSNDERDEFGKCPAAPTK